MVARSGSTKLRFETAGDGPPLLLVMGLGLPGAAWWRTVPVLAEHFTVISFDNRGAGLSDAPPGPYSLAQMAADALAVLDAAGADRAHVYGISMGGMVAQELAIRHADRVAGLVLGATGPGGAAVVQPDAEIVDFLLRRPGMDPEEALWASVPYVYGLETRRKNGARIGEDLARRRTFRFNAAGYQAQLAAAWQHDAATRLAGIDAPTLVVHGLEDRLVPADNGRALVDAIPGAQGCLLAGAGHAYPTDEPAVDREIILFLQAIPPAAAARSIPAARP